MCPIEIPENSLTRFSNRVENYIKYRPHYPNEVIGFFSNELGLKPTHIIADIGSGTGISTEPFLKNGNTVFAVEPNKEMREAAERLLKAYPNLKGTNGTAENTSLKKHSIDFIVAAQAFHWFKGPETNLEFKRILKKDGFVVLMWNERVEVGTPFLESYENLLQKYGVDYMKLRRQNMQVEGDIPKFFGAKGCEIKKLPNEQKFDFEGLKGRLLSSSYAPAQGHPNHEPMMQELRSIFEENNKGGLVSMPYETTLYYGKLS